MEHTGIPAISNPGSDNKYTYNGKEKQGESLGGVKLDWYDYGARFYDPQTGRFTTVDPLTEWHFNYTPYHYTFNNPINFFDPFGLDTVLVNKVDWPKFDPKVDIIKLDDATVTSKGYSFLGRLFRKIGRAFKGGNSTYEKESGIEFTTQFGAGGNENSTARNPDAESVNVDLIMALKPNAGPKSFGFDPLGFAKSIRSASKAIKEANGTSDRQIVEQSTGTAEKTDTHGEPLKTEDHWIPDNLAEGSPVSTRNGDVSYQKGDSLYRDSVPRVGRGYYKYWRIQNANRK